MENSTSEATSHLDSFNLQVPGEYAENKPSRTEESNEKLEGTNDATPALLKALQDMLNATKEAEEKGNTGNTQAWAVVLEAMMKFDERLTSGWKDDLQNMLIFAGLFSAVVTAFVIESYSWLQEDPSDTSNQLLVHVSQQLSSFTFANGFINSTIPSATPPTFMPEPVYVRINMLWFLSLAMSLIASLFAIVIQQWMQAYRFTAYSSVREAVRLRQLRYEALCHWGVSWIVSVVPVLLQVALTLFLIGGWLLLETTNKTVFTPYATFAAVSLALFGASVIAPLCSSNCPYRSSLSCVLAVITMAITIILGSTVLLLSFVLATMRSAMGYLALQLYLPASAPRSFTLNMREWRLCRRELLDLLRFPMRFAKTGPTDVWINQERSVLAKRQNLEQSALSWVLPWLSNADFPEYKRCLDELPLDKRPDVVTKWIAQNFCTPFSSMLISMDDMSSFLKILTPTPITKNEFVDQYSDILLDFLPESWAIEDAVTANHGITVLVVLRRIIGGCGTLPDAFRRLYTKKVIALRHSQERTRLNEGEVGSYKGSIMRLPTSALFECSAVLKYDFGDEELSSLLSFAEQIFSGNTPLSDSSEPHDWNYSVDLVLSSSATVLDAMARCPRAPSNNILWHRHLDLLAKLRDFIAAESTRIRDLALQAEWRRAQEFIAVPSTVIPALKCIAKSIVILAQAGYLWEKEACPSRGLVDNFAVLFAGPTIPENLRKECLSELRPLLHDDLSQHHQTQFELFAWRVRRYVYEHLRYLIR